MRDRYAIEIVSTMIGPIDLRHVKDIRRDEELIRVWKLVELTDSELDALDD